MTDDNDLRVINLSAPTLETIKLEVEGGHMIVDVGKLKTAADELGAGKYDVLSIGGYRNARGEFVADYSSVRIEPKR